GSQCRPKPCSSRRARRPRSSPSRPIGAEMTIWKIPDARKELSRYYTGVETHLTAVPGESPLDETAIQLRRIIEALSLTSPDLAHIPSTNERLRAIADEL